MKSRLASVPLAALLLTAAGCLHPPLGHLNDQSTSVPPLGKFTHRHNLPPAEMLMGPGPGVDGPGPGVLMGEPLGPVAPGQSAQVAFTSPDGMTVHWDVSSPGAFDSEPLTVPGRQNFPQGGIYRMKLSNIAGRPGIELYPTLEVGPSTARTEAYLAHNAIPIQLVEEDLDQVLSGNFVTKVIYLPDPEFQELAIAGVETLVSTRLDPGVDPIVEADRRGSILAILRIGNKDLETPDAEYAGGPLPFGGQLGIPCAAVGGSAVGLAGPGLPPGFVAGVTAPQYGMPMSGTPIGLPGPPHVPLGGPAGLKKHVIANHTKSHIPSPVDKVRIDVKQEPGFSYPQPPSRVTIHEKSHVPPVKFRRPLSDWHEHANDAPEAGYRHGHGH
jgi:hypothetical protein